MDVPLAFGCGLTTSVRFAPDPPRVSAAGVFATISGFDEDAVRVRLAAAVWLSPTVKAIAASACLPVVVRFAMAVMVGGRFAANDGRRQLAMVFRALLIESALLCCATVPVGKPL